MAICRPSLRMWNCINETVGWICLMLDTDSIHSSNDGYITPWIYANFSSQRPVIQLIVNSCRRQKISPSRNGKKKFGDREFFQVSNFIHHFFMLSVFFSEAGKHYQRLSFLLSLGENDGFWKSKLRVWKYIPSSNLSMYMEERDFRVARGIVNRYSEEDGS